MIFHEAAVNVWGVMIVVPLNSRPFRREPVCTNQQEKTLVGDPGEPSEASRVFHLPLGI